MKNAMPWDLLNPNTKYVPENVYDDRFEKCKACKNFITLTTQCSECKCIMKIKCAVSHAFCPIDKWGQYELSAKSN